MGGLSRTKGKVGERELASLLSALTGYTVARRVRQHDGDDDLMGLPGWSIECKRYATATPALVADRGAWTAVWPACVHLGGTDTAEHLTATPSTWWAMAGQPPQ